MKLETFQKAIERLGKPCSARLEDLHAEFLKTGKLWFADTGDAGADDLFADEDDARAVITDFFMEDIADPDHFRSEENCCTIIDMTEVLEDLAHDVEAEESTALIDMFEQLDIEIYRDLQQVAVIPMHHLTPDPSGASFREYNATEIEIAITAAISELIYPLTLQEVTVVPLDTTSAHTCERARWEVRLGAPLGDAPDTREENVSFIVCFE